MAAEHKPMTLLASKTELLHDPAIPLLGIYPEKTVIRKDTYTLYVHSNTIHNSQGMEAT